MKIWSWLKSFFSAEFEDDPNADAAVAMMNVYNNQLTTIIVSHSEDEDK
jgi:hypothetical protein